MRQFSATLFAALALISSAAQASQPTTLGSFGEWSLGELGVEVYSGEDSTDPTYEYVLVLAQTVCPQDASSCDSLQVSWSGTSVVEISAEFDGCDGEVLWEPRYYVTVEQWRSANVAMESQIEKDFSAWLGQAALLCASQERAAAFKMKHVRQGVRAFTRILNERTQHDQSGFGN